MTQSKSYNIRSERGRKALKPRVDPYWEPLGDGTSIGLYVGVSGMAWKARKPGNGKRWSKTTLGKLTDMDYATAVRAAQDWADQADTPAETAAPVLTVGQCADDWLAKMSKSHSIQTANTSNGHASRVRMVKAFFGADTPVADLTVAKIESYRDRTNAKTGKPLAISSVNTDMNKLNAMLTLGAERAGYTGERVWLKVDRLKSQVDEIHRADNGEDSEYSGRVFTPREIARLADAADADFADFIKAMFLTCTRIQALRMADVRDLDTEAGTLRLRRGKNAGKRGVITIRLFESAVTFLGECAEGKGPNDPLLSMADGSRWAEGFQRTRFDRAVKAAGLRNADGVTMAHLRHSGITWAVERAKLDPVTVAKMADTSVDMILKHYFRPVDGPGKGPRL